MRARTFIAPPEPLTVPTKWVQFVFAVFLLPICAVVTQTFFTAFARATVTQRLWTGEEFWFFSLGAILWLIAFLGLPRPILIYVFGHELTHALWVWLMGGRVSRFRVSSDGGHVVTTKANFWIALAPYFFPIYSVLAIAIYGALSLCLNMQPYGRWLYGVIGATWAFHFTFTCWMIPKKPDRSQRSGHVFFTRRHLPDESAIAKRDADSWLSTHHLRKLRRGFTDESRELPDLVT